MVVIIIAEFPSPSVTPTVTVTVLSWAVCVNPLLTGQRRINRGTRGSATTLCLIEPLGGQVVHKCQQNSRFHPILLSSLPPPLPHRHPLRSPHVRQTRGRFDLDFVFYLLCRLLTFSCPTSSLNLGNLRVFCTPTRLVLVFGGVFD